LGNAGDHPLWISVLLTPRNMLISTRVILPNSVVLGQTIYEHNYRDLPENVDPSRSTFQGHSRSVEVIHINRLSDFPLVFHSNYSPISYHFRDKWQYFPFLLYLTTPLRGSLRIL